MTVLPFGEVDSEYSIYQGALGSAWFVRMGNHLIGVGRDREHAQAIAKADRLRTERARRESQVFFLAA